MLGFCGIDFGGCWRSRTIWQPPCLTMPTGLQPATGSNTHILYLASRYGVEPQTFGFGGHCSANWANETLYHIVQHTALSRWISSCIGQLSTLPTLLSRGPLRMAYNALNYVEELNPLHRYFPLSRYTVWRVLDWLKAVWRYFYPAKSWRGC